MVTTLARSALFLSGKINTGKIMKMKFAFNLRFDSCFSKANFFSFDDGGQKNPFNEFQRSHISVFNEPYWSFTKPVHAGLY